MIIQDKNFNVQQIADSGQCFRMNKIGDNKYSNIAMKYFVELEQIDSETVELSCSEWEWENIWKEYFHMGFDYASVVGSIRKGDDEFLVEAVNYGSGIRILSQDPYETLISFIISQRKSIPAIKTCIEKLSAKLGCPMTSSNGVSYYAFPAPHILAEASLEDLRELGLGYRDTYVKKAAQKVASGDLDLEELKYFHTKSISELKLLDGVGEKVANCVALFGLGHIEAFPIDVWIQRIIDNEYNGVFDTSKYKGYAGLVQQYMFYYYRSINK